MPEEQREGLQEELIDIILLILERNPQLHYYQGYHDIVVTFLLVVGEGLATSLVEKLSTHHLRYRCRGTEEEGNPIAARGPPHPPGPAPRENSSAQCPLIVFSVGAPFCPLSPDPGVRSDRAQCIVSL